jgi:hypothetical protein
MPRLLQMQAFLSPIRSISVIIKRATDCPEMADPGDAARTAHRSAERSTELTPRSHAEAANELKSVFIRVNPCSIFEGGA